MKSKEIKSINTYQVKSKENQQNTKRIKRELTKVCLRKNENFRASKEYHKKQKRIWTVKRNNRMKILTRVGSNGKAYFYPQDD